MLDMLGLLPYDLLMFYAFFKVGSAWAWGRRREVHDAALALLGLGVPIGAWVFTQFFSWAGLLVVASYGGLWYWASGHEAVSVDGLQRLREADRAAAQARLRQAPDDGVAHLMMAQEWEKEGRWADALAAFEAAHRLSDRLFPEPAMESARERLERALADKRPAPRRADARGFIMRRRDWALAVLVFLLLPWSPPRALAAAAALAFARWLTADEDDRPAHAAF